MKVLHVLPSLSYKLGGPTQAALNTVRALRDLGIDAEIATTNDDEAGLLSVPTGCQVDYNGIPVWFFSRLARFKEFIPSAELTQWFIAHLSEYDIIHTHYLFCYAPTIAAKLAYHYHIPYITRTIGQLSPWALQQSQRKKQIYSRLIERPTLNRAAAIHCTTSAEAEDAHRFGVLAPTIVSPLGVKATPVVANASQQLRDRYHLPPDCKVILFLSRLHEKKRPDFLLNVFARLHPKIHNYHLFLAGDGDTGYCDRLKALAHTSKISKNVTFTGFISGIDKDILLQGSDLFALPSHSENFGVAVAEALAAGLPVVITPDVQISPAIQEATAGLVVPGYSSGWVSALGKLLTSSKLRQKMGQNAQKLAQEQYNWPQISLRLAQTYQEVLSKKPLSLEYSKSQQNNKPNK
ncbi:group 1 glycosyl transferase [filamentous cyanobacterium CCT1]|nr:group 1 glycosyl transferase [filamentous cyanobacterium CCT1]PSN80453.1 group 1 glycosyl transferase [filamentous cyanobacterium CCP4]